MPRGRQRPVHSGHRRRVRRRDGGHGADAAAWRSTVRRGRRAGEPRYGQLSICYGPDQAECEKLAYEQFRWSGLRLAGQVRTAGTVGVRGGHPSGCGAEDVASGVCAGPTRTSTSAAIRKYVDAGFTHVCVARSAATSRSRFWTGRAASCCRRCVTRGPAMRRDHGAEGVPVRELSDEDLTREMQSVHRTRDDTLRHGPDAALSQHSERMAELEAEYLRRNPDREVTRSRAASRAARGQPVRTALDPEADTGPGFRRGARLDDVRRGGARRAGTHPRARVPARPGRHGQAR